MYIDHVGRIPCLLAAGFKGPILYSEPFAKLLPILLEDAFKLGFSCEQKQVEGSSTRWQFAQLLTVDSHQAHLAMIRHLTETARPAIVIARNVMCSSGRIVNYLKSIHSARPAAQPGPRHRGRAIQTYGPRGGYADLDGQRYDIRAQIHTIGSYLSNAEISKFCYADAGMAVRGEDCA